jgi:acetoin utilization deacetylase AcuC-like enzyme
MLPEVGHLAPGPAPRMRRSERHARAPPPAPRRECGMANGMPAPPLAPHTASAQTGGMHPVLIYSPSYGVDIGPHVFPTEKYRRVHEQLMAEGWAPQSETFHPPVAQRALLELAHTTEYLDDLEALRQTPRTVDAEMPLGREIVEFFRRSVEGTCVAAHSALARRAAVHVGGGFHHAMADHAEGFCYLNDVAVAIRQLQKGGRVRRAAVVDVDVHQGNGTARIFESDASVFTLSLHQQQNYPTPKATSTLDLGLDNDTNDDEYDAALTGALASVWAHEPEIVIMVAGADPYIDDQLGGLALTLDGLERRDRRVLEGCASRNIPVVVTFGGGYARRLEDTVRIHACTCRIALAIAGLSPSASPGRVSRTATSPNL